MSGHRFPGAASNWFSLRSGPTRLLQKLPHGFVVGGGEVVQSAVEDQAAFFEHEEGGIAIGLSLGQRNHVALLRIKAMGAEGKGVLQAMRHQDGGDVIHMTLLYDQLDDGG